MKPFSNIIKRLILLCTVLVVCMVVFRGNIYHQFFHYKTIGSRTAYSITDKKLFDYIENNTTSFQPENAEDIIRKSLKLTARQLDFATKGTNNDPNRLIHTQHANCIGYSAFFSATCNYLFKKYGFSDNWTSETQIGQIYFCGINIHPYFNSPFFNDHDFNCVINKETGQKYAVDPTLYDYFYIDYITFK